MNLIKNAVEAMDQRGAVTLRVRRDGKSDPPAVTLEVEDTGPGMDPATLDRAAIPFHHQSSGSGLG